MLPLIYRSECRVVYRARGYLYTASPSSSSSSRARWNQERITLPELCSRVSSLLLLYLLLPFFPVAVSKYLSEKFKWLFLTLEQVLIYACVNHGSLAASNRARDETYGTYVYINIYTYNLCVPYIFFLTTSFSLSSGFGFLSSAPSNLLSTA